MIYLTNIFCAIEFSVFQYLHVSEKFLTTFPTFESLNAIM